jgi:hypothetical protein
MKILGEANNRALATNNVINEILLRGDPRFFMFLYENFFIKYFSLFFLSLSSIPALIIYNFETINITSQ